MVIRKQTTQKASVVVNAWVKESELRKNAVMKQSVQELIEQMQTPVAKGGRMRVDTGFLRASGAGAIGQMPVGPSRKPDDKDAKYGDGSTVPDATILAIAKLKPGQTFFFGWTANYARYREARDAFMRMALQNFQSIVNDVSRRAKARVAMNKDK